MKRWLIEWGYIHQIVEMAEGIGDLDAAVKKAFERNGVPKSGTLITVSQIEDGNVYRAEVPEWALVKH